MSNGANCRSIAKSENDRPKDNKPKGNGEKKKNGKYPP